MIEEEIAQIPTILNSLATATRALAEAQCETPRLDSEILLAHALNKERIWLLAHPNVTLTPKQHALFAAFVARRADREPIAYIIGFKFFFALKFRVNAHTLVPRPETELLVETALALSRQRGNQPRLRCVDVGTGSGCIAVSLAKHLPQAQITAIDLSTDALAVARQNAQAHGVTDRIEFTPGNLLQPVSGPVDMIVSNPPYVAAGTLAAPHSAPEVHRYEPRLALDGGPDGLAVIEPLLAQAGQCLAPEGSLLVEIGWDQGDAVRRLAKKHISDAKIEIKPDLAGRDRLLVAQLIR